MKERKKKSVYIFPRSNDSMSEDTFSQNLETLDNESVDMLQGADVQFQGYTDLPMIGPSDSIQSRNQYYDSGDSDDYAESDNWMGMEKNWTRQSREEQAKKGGKGRWPFSLLVAIQ